jgi:hypothetical protein
MKTNKNLLYVLVVVVILVISVVGWYYFSYSGNMVCTDCGGGGGGNYTNSCKDSDGGGVATVKGTVSGYKNNQYYSYTDTCGGTYFLREYYCQGVSSTYSTVSCQTNKTTQCINGACV